MGNELELEGLLFEEDESIDFQTESDLPDTAATMSERWASWIDIVNR
ncbi:MAG: hypothetical protein L3J12_00845 [Spirochaetales bacterium]|nr:hypothetical protein [Spirochaetales bacterium]